MSGPTRDDAKAALSAWLAAAVPDDVQRREGSRLVAAYVAACVRQDRATQAITNKIADLVAQMGDLGVTVPKGGKP